MWLSKGEDQIVSKKASVKFKLIRCILESSLDSSYNSGTFSLHSLLAKPLVQAGLFGLEKHGNQTVGCVGNRWKLYLRLAVKEASSFFKHSSTQKRVLLDSPFGKPNQTKYSWQGNKFYGSLWKPMQENRLV